MVKFSPFFCFGQMFDAKHCDGFAFTGVYVSLVIKNV